MNEKHNNSSSRLYGIWDNMKQRCGNKNAANYKRYGGKGISVCSAWERYSLFHDWAMANGYAEHLTLDRIDNNGNYEPDNCRWATYTTQNRNQQISSRNKSGIRGVHFNRKRNKWAAEIKIDGKNIRLGMFTNISEAATARLQGENTYWID